MIEPMWLTHLSFYGLVQSSWPPSSSNFIQSIQSLKTAMCDWNKTTFGNIFQQKKRLLSRLKGIQSTLHHQQNPNLLLLEK